MRSLGAEGKELEEHSPQIVTSVLWVSDDQAYTCYLGGVCIHVCTQLYTHVYTTVYTRVHCLALSMSPAGLSCTDFLELTLRYCCDTAKTPSDRS